MLRRQLLGLLGMLPFTGKAMALSRTQQELWLGNCDSLECLKSALERLPNKQVLAKPIWYCEETGEAFREVYAWQIFRPGDEIYAERAVAKMMKFRIQEIFTDRVHGTIYWRMPLEWEISSSPQVIRYCDDGPDYDAMIDRKCQMDHNFKVLKAYCRLAVGRNING